MTHNETARIIQQAEKNFSRQKDLSERIFDHLEAENSISVAGKVESTQELSIHGASGLIPRTDIICGLADPCYDLDELSGKIGKVFDSLKNITQRANLSPAVKDAIEPNKGARQYKRVILDRAGSKQRIRWIICISIFPDSGIANTVLENRLLTEAGVQTDSVPSQKNNE